MAHLITGNKFDPNKDIPDLSGKVRLNLVLTTMQFSNIVGRSTL